MRCWRPSPHHSGSSSQSTKQVSGLLRDVDTRTALDKVFYLRWELGGSSISALALLQAERPVGRQRGPADQARELV